MTQAPSLLDPRPAWREARTGPEELLVGGLLLAVVAAGTWMGFLPIVMLAAVGIAGLAAAIMDPRLFLIAYVALIPFEGSAALGGVTNLSRFAGIAFAVGHVYRRRTAIRLDTMPLAGWAFVAFASASFLWSIDRTMSLPQILTLVQLFVIAVLIADFIVLEERAARWVGLAYATAAVGTGLVGLFIWVTAKDTLVAGRASAFPGQDAAQFAAVLIPGLLVLVWETLRRPRVLPVVGATILAVAILASGTRSAWVATGLALAAGFLPRIGVRQRIGVGIALAAIALMAFVIPPLYAATYGRLSDAISSGGTGRVDIWTIGLRLWTQQPLAGLGYATFPAALTLEAMRATAIPTPDTGFLTPPVGSHSVIVGTLLELGIIGFGCLVAFFWSVARPRRNDVSLGEIARLAVLTMLVQALFLDVLGRKQLWLFIALAGGLAAAHRLRQREPVPEGAAEVARAPAALAAVAPDVAPDVAPAASAAVAPDVAPAASAAVATLVPTVRIGPDIVPEVSPAPRNIVIAPAPPTGPRHNIVVAQAPDGPVHELRRRMRRGEESQEPVETAVPAAPGTVSSTTRTEPPAPNAPASASTAKRARTPKLPAVAEPAQAAPPKSPKSPKSPKPAASITNAQRLSLRDAMPAVGSTDAALPPKPAAVPGAARGRRRTPTPEGSAPRPRRTGKPTASTGEAVATVDPQAAQSIPPAKPASGAQPGPGVKPVSDVPSGQGVKLAAEAQPAVKAQPPAADLSPQPSPQPKPQPKPPARRRQRADGESQP